MDSASSDRPTPSLPTLTNRRTTVLALVATGLLSARVPVGAFAQEATPPAGEEHHVYFGWLLGTNELAAVALDFGAPSSANSWPVRAYVCDGLGLPAGLAVWFKGSADKEAVESSGDGVTLVSPSGQETLVIGNRNDYAVTGAFTGADGSTRRFAAFRAIDGAGIYDVTLDDDLRYQGQSTDGAVLEAQADENGHVAGTITTGDGQEIAFTVNALALLPDAELGRWGLPTAFTQYADNSLVPDTYVALISPGGLFWLGRNGDVRKGEGGNNIIGLDMGE